MEVDVIEADEEPALTLTRAEARALDQYLRRVEVDLSAHIEVRFGREAVQAYYMEHFYEKPALCYVVDLLSDVAGSDD